VRALLEAGAGDDVSAREECFGVSLAGASAGNIGERMIEQKVGIDGLRGEMDVA